MKGTANSNIIGASTMFARTSPIQITPNLSSIEGVLELIADKYVYFLKENERDLFTGHLKKAFCYNMDIALVKCWHHRQSGAPFDNRSPMTVPYSVAYIVSALSDYREKEQPDIFMSRRYFRGFFKDYIMDDDERGILHFANEWKALVFRATRDLPNKANSWVQTASGVDSLLLTGVLRVDGKGDGADMEYYSVSRRHLGRVQELMVGALRLRRFEETYTESYLPVMQRDEQPAFPYLVSPLRSSRAYSLRDFDNEVLESFYRRA
jgi:hypothetical protein